MDDSGGFDFVTTTTAVVIVVVDVVAAAVHEPAGSNSYHTILIPNLFWLP